MAEGYLRGIVKFVRSDIDDVTGPSGKVCSLEVEVPDAGTYRIAKEGDKYVEADPRPATVRVVGWGKMARQVKSFEAGNVVQVSGELVRNEWPEDKDDPEGLGHSRMEVHLNDGHDGHEIVEADKDGKPTNQATLRGVVLHAGEMESFGRKGKKRRILLGAEKRGQDGNLLLRDDGTPKTFSMAVEIVGKHAEPDRARGDRLEITGRIENDTWLGGDGKVRHAGRIVVAPIKAHGVLPLGAGETAEKAAE
jgi:single-stranded DNA-binding protein